MSELKTKSTLSAGAASAVGGAVGSFGQVFSTLIANRLARQRAEEAYKREEASIAKQNFYNSPSQQMLRLKAAGINPMLPFSGPGGEMGLQNSAAQGYPAETFNPDFSPLGRGIMQGVNANLEAQRVFNDTERTAAQVALQSQEAFKMAQEGRLTQLQADEYPRLIGITEDSMRVQIRKSIEEINNLKKDASLKDIQYELARQDIHVKEGQIEKLASETGLNNAQILRVLQLLPHEIRNLDADSAYKYFQSRPQLVEKVAAEIALLGQEKYKTQAQMVNLYREGKYIDAKNVTSMVFAGMNTLCNVSNAVHTWVNPIGFLQKPPKLPQYNVSPGAEYNGFNPYE